MNLAVVGSRTFDNYELAEKLIREIVEKHNITCIVSGKAKGADTLARNYAINENLELIEYVPDWSIGRHAGILRNTKIIQDSDVVLALWDGTSKGTKDSIDKAKSFGKILYIYNTTTNTFI